MLKKTRPVAVVTAVLLCAAWMPAHVQADTSRFFTKDTEVVLNINFTQIWQSPLLKENKELVALVKGMIENQLQQNEEAAKFQKALEFDPFTDLHSITYAGPGGTDQDKAVVVATGNFKAKNFNEVAGQLVRQYPDMIKTQKVGGVSVYQVSPPNNEQFVMALANEKTLLITQTLDGMKQALAQDRAAAKPAVTKELKTLLAKTDAKQSVYGVMTKSALNKFMKENQNPQFQGAAQLVEEVEGLVGTVTITKEIEFALNVNAKNAAKAQELSKTASNALLLLNATLQGQAQDNPQMLPVLEVTNTLRASSTGETMTVNGRVPGALIQQGIQMLKLLVP